MRLGWCNEAAHGNLIIGFSRMPCKYANQKIDVTCRSRDLSVVEILAKFKEDVKKI